MKTVILVALVGLTLAMLPARPSVEFAVQVNDIWRDDDLVAPFDFPIFKSADQLEAERREVRLTVPPVFAEVPNAGERVEAHIDSLSRQLYRIFNEYASWQRNQLRNQSAEASQDSARYHSLREALPLRITSRQWNYLRDSFTPRVPDVATPTQVPQQGATLDEVLFTQIRIVTERLHRTGSVDVPADSIHTPDVVVRNMQQRTERRVPIADVYPLDAAQTFAQNQLRQRYQQGPDTVALGMALFRAVFEPNLTYLPAETQERLLAQEAAISATTGKIRQGQIIIRQGEIVTENVHQQLQSLARVRAEQVGNIDAWKASLGVYVPAIIALFIFFLYLFLLRRQIFDVNKHVLLIAILFGAITTLFGITVRLENMPGFMVPVAIVSILFTVIYDSRVGIFGTLTLALLGGLFFGFDYEYTFATIFAGILAVFSVRDIKNRGQFIVTAGLVFIAYAITMGAFSVTKLASLERFANDMSQVAINSILLLLAYPLLWVFERAFRVTTDVTLLELSDTNRPLLKELSLRAPGTFNHTLQVANLAEAAANAIGANALLARVGALHHDIGKMLKPEYFVENQRPGSNPHDKLTPHMSALILASHVKDGVELARQYDLPEVVIDFIPMHHGTSRIEYFYRKACDEQKPGSPEVSESEFRYPGPRPDSNETGIMMLADSVEAASRSIAKPTRKRLEDLIDSIFKARIDDGQLDLCSLTFADLRVIRNTFLSVLSGVYHFRVKYPGQRQEDDTEELTGEEIAETGVPSSEFRTKPPPELHNQVSRVLGGKKDGNAHRAERLARAAAQRKDDDGSDV